MKKTQFLMISLAGPQQIRKLMHKKFRRLKINKIMKMDLKFKNLKF